MWRARALRAAALGLAGLMTVGAVHAEVTPVAPPDVRPRVAAQLGDEAQTIARTLATVRDKLGEVDDLRARRLRAAYRLLRAPLPGSATAADRMAASRRRAGARLLVERDLAERLLLADEAARLAAAGERTTAAEGKLPTLGPPPRLGRPAPGPIARAFGTLLHERSGAVLSRRGVDLEVTLRAPAGAPADGVIRYAGPIRGLDDGVIIDHGAYWTVVAKLAELVVPVGTAVHRGDRLGRAARGRVYLELRVRIGPGGIPIDPAPLLDATP